MPWTTPITWAAGSVVGASQLNQQVRDNLNYLISRPHQVIKRDATYSTTSTVFVEMDSVNLSINLTLSGSAVFVGFSASVVNPAQFDLSVDGVRYTSFANGLLSHTIGFAYSAPISYAVLVNGLSVGSHTFRPLWCVPAARLLQAALSFGLARWRDVFGRD
jgi:hypothetical protein